MAAAQPDSLYGASTLNVNWSLLAPLLVTTIVAVVGWHAAHRLAAARDREAKRRALVTEHLVDAYRELEPYWHVTSDNARGLERAVAVIQLLGSPEQVRLAQEFAVAFARDSTAALDPLLLSLRATLRKDLGLPEVKGGLKYLRVGDGRPSSGAV